ncbi:MAG: beta-ketoacyl-ACP synthase II [Capsulimonadaceae bacterium]|nr:beta-ketoacyl-ACP synthase II [Capsulimonadaceae bacterium]
MSRRVVITGIGAVTPLGIGKDIYWKNLLAGKSGVILVDRLDLSEIATRIAAEVRDFSPEQWLEKREARRMDRFAQFAVAASKMALEDAALEITPELAPRVGTHIGSGVGGLNTLEKEAEIGFAKGIGKISPFFIPMMIANMGTGSVARIIGARGPSQTTVTACATSTNSIGDAFWLIREGKADVMVAGGAEAAITPMAMAGFSNMRAMSRRNDDPQRASRPFDRDRDGFILGEGAGVIVLEARDNAMARGAQIYAEVVGYGMSNDAYDMVAPSPSGDGAAAAMRAALEDAGAVPEQVEHINPHATSTPAGDVAETNAVKTVFGKHAKKIAISGTKSMTGHLLGAAGAVELIAAALAIRDSIVPPTINLDNPDDACDLDYVPHVARKLHVEYAMSNSFGFGGHNASVVLRAHHE